MGLSNRVVERKKVLIEQQWGIHFIVWGGGGGKKTDGELTTKKWEADEHAKR
jgi:hypothetical protein